MRKGGKSGIVVVSNYFVTGLVCLMQSVKRDLHSIIRGCDGKPPFDTHFFFFFVFSLEVDPSYSLSLSFSLPLLRNVGNVGSACGCGAPQVVGNVLTLYFSA